MASQSLYQSKVLIPLEDLKSQIDEFKELILPDILCDTNMGDYAFSHATPEEMELDPTDNEPIVVVRKVSTNKAYLMTPWCRSQLLQHMGVKEKWLRWVHPKVQAAELNLRDVMFAGHRLRPMKLNKDFNAMRGIVSHRYASIDDTTIMESLQTIVPDAKVAGWMSGKTDRALYAYISSGKALNIPGTRLTGTPGFVVKNSEVGFTSLWLVPTLMVGGVCLSIQAHEVLRRAHRGNPKDLLGDLDKAIKENAVVWGGLSGQLHRLGDYAVASEEGALEAIGHLISNAGGTKAFALACKQMYTRTKNTVHSGVTILEAVVSVVHVASRDKDEAHVRSTVAGAVLLNLIR